MGDAFADLPGWVKGLIIAAALGGSNGLQYLGIGAPAKSDAAFVDRERGWCMEQLAQTQDGMRLDERLCDLEKGVERLEKAQIVMHGEKKVDRALLNSIAAKLAVPPAPEVQPLPEASEEP
jgi:hypothetical protein